MTALTAMRKNIVPPTLIQKEADIKGLNITTKAKNKEINNVIINSSSLGGNYITILVKKISEGG